MAFRAAAMALAVLEDESTVIIALAVELITLVIAGFIGPGYEPAEYGPGRPGFTAAHPGRLTR